MPDHGPDPDYDPSEEVLKKAVQVLATAQARMLVGAYVEKPANGGAKLLNWLLGIISVLLTAGIIGQIVMYGDVRELKAQVADIKKIVDIRFRGGGLLDGEPNDGARASPRE